MGWTSPIFGIRISPTLTMSAGAVGLAGGGIGPVRGAGFAWTGGSVVAVVGGIGRSWKGTVVGVPTGDAAATASAGFVWSTATTMPLSRTTAIRAESTGTEGTRHRPRGRDGGCASPSTAGTAGGKRAYRSSGDDVSWPGSPGGGEVDTQRLFAPAGATPAAATELQSGGTYVRKRPFAALVGTRAAGMTG